MGGFVAGSVARVTERDKGIREKMILQAEAVSKRARSVIVRLEDLEHGSLRSELPLLSQEVLILRKEVGELHVLFHRQVVALADELVAGIQDALENASAERPAKAGQPSPIETAADALDIWCECAGADIRRPSGFWRYDRFGYAKWRFDKHAKAVMDAKNHVRKNEKGKAVGSNAGTQANAR